MYRFLGHGSSGGTLTYGGKVYAVGDNVPMSKEVMLHHAAAGLSFEGVEEPELIPSIPPTPPDNRPRDNRGAVVETAASK